MPTSVLKKPNQTDAEVKSQVHRYYDATTEDYLKYYQTDWHHHMHYGFDRHLPKGGNPTEHMVRFLAKLAEVKSGDRLLDSGCGVGGSSIFLAKELGCISFGITLVESQAKLAKGFAAKGKGAGRPLANFLVNDFHTPAFKPESFDVVWAVESFDHAIDKAAWVQSMYTLLRPGGRLVIADGFRGKKPETTQQSESYGRFLKGWAVPHLCSPEEMESYGAKAGFKMLHGEDITIDVLPHSRAIFRFGLIFIPIRWLLEKWGITSSEKLGNAYATFYQYRTLKQKLWTYRAYCFQKPF